MENKSKTLAGLGMRTLDEYVDSLPAHAEKPEVWVNINDDSCINVSHIGSKYAYYSEDGSSDSHSMDIKHFTENYRLAGLGKELAPAADDTFNDDTPAQTFSDIKWDDGTNEKSELVVVVPCPSCDRAVPYDRHGALFLVGKMAVCSDCYAKNSKEGFNAGKKYMTRVPNLWRRDEKKVEAADSVPIKVGEDLVVAIRELQKAIDSDNVIGLIKAAYKVVKFAPISEASK